MNQANFDKFFDELEFLIEGDIETAKSHAKMYFENEGGIWGTKRHTSILVAVSKARETTASNILRRMKRLKEKYEY